jgi:uncharacterized UPF0160 family protein
MNNEKILRSFGTHDGSFHADEVTACGLLLLFDLIEEDKIYRTRDSDTLQKCEYVCDVGGIYDPSKKLFDHHQADYKGPLSSAGMVLLYLRDSKRISEKVYQFFNNTLIIGVDDHDNGKDLQPKGHSSYSYVVSNFAPIPYDPTEEEQNRAFIEALHFAAGHLRRLHDRYQYVQSCRPLVEAEMKKNRDVLIFDKGIPWLQLFFDMGGEGHPAKFVIMPSGPHWNLRCIPPNYEDRMSVRIPMPEEWAGLLEEDFKKVGSVSGGVFCHKGRFISVWETKEAALQALEYVRRKAKNNGDA